MYTKTKADIPKRTRKAPALFEKTTEWKLMKADMDKGLKPGEKLNVVMSEYDLKACGITQPRTVARFITRYIKDNKLGYEVNRSHKDGQESVWVIQPGKARGKKAA
jgi:hypothetical protein